MSDSDRINYIINYLEAFDDGNEVTRPIIEAERSVVDEIKEYILSL